MNFVPVTSLWDIPVSLHSEDQNVDNLKTYELKIKHFINSAQVIFIAQKM